MGTEIGINSQVCAASQTRDGKEHEARAEETYLIAGSCSPKASLSIPSLPRETFVSQASRRKHMGGGNACVLKFPHPVRNIASGGWRRELKLSYVSFGLYNTGASSSGNSLLPPSLYFPSHRAGKKKKNSHKRPSKERGDDIYGSSKLGRNAAELIVPSLLVIPRISFPPKKNSFIFSRKCGKRPVGLGRPPSFLSSLGA